MLISDHHMSGVGLVGQRQRISQQPLWRGDGEEREKRVRERPATCFGNANHWLPTCIEMPLGCGGSEGRARWRIGGRGERERATHRRESTNSVKSIVALDKIVPGL
jgi:hypothetical protein